MSIIKINLVEQHYQPIELLINIEANTRQGVELLTEMTGYEAKRFNQHYRQPVRI
jgi:hypothetical protein